MRHQTAASEANRELNSSEFSNTSIEEEQALKVEKKVEKTQIGSHMSKILAEFDNEDSE